MEKILFLNVITIWREVLINSRPQNLRDLHGQSHLKEQIRFAVESAKKSNDAIGHVLLTGPPGTGKAQPFSSKILTPDGWKSMGEIEVGSIVSTPFGVDVVDYVFYQGEQNVFKIIFDDCRFAFCTKDHLWYVIDSYGMKRLLTLSELISYQKESKITFSVPLLPQKEIINSIDQFDRYEDAVQNQKLAWADGLAAYLKIKWNDAQKKYIYSIQKNNNDGLLEIKNIIDTHIKEECQCIKLKGEEGLYITNDYIVTHNTTIASILANERKVDFFPVIATAIKNSNDLVEIFETQLSMEGYAKHSPAPLDPKQIRPTVLFIDEIHNLKRKIYETLYTVMEDRIYWADEKDAWSGRDMKEKRWVPKFTLVGATTREGDLEKPFLDRFRYRWKLSRYSVSECLKFVLNTLESNKIKADNPNTIRAIACRARGTARNAIQLTQQCIDVCRAENKDILTHEMVEYYFKLSNIDEYGLTDIDRKILKYLYDAYRPIGIKAIASFVEENPLSIENHYEPYLVSLQFIGRTPRGRAITAKGIEYLRKSKLIPDSKRTYFIEQVIK